MRTDTAFPARIGLDPVASSLSTAEFDGFPPGTYEALVYAYDPANGNTAFDRTPFDVEAER